jgi:lysophospholipase L1-like esterase
VDDPTCFPAATSPCWITTIEAMKRGLSRIVRTVHAVDANPALRVAVVGYWNLTVDGSAGRVKGPDFVRGSDELTRVVNSAIASVADLSGATYVDAYAPLKGDGSLDPTTHLLDDGDHPNQSGHRLLMRAILSALDAEGAVTDWRRG